MSSTLAAVLATIADVLVALLALAVGGLAARARDLTGRLDQLEDELEAERLLSRK